MSLPTLVIGLLGVSQIENERTGNPFFRGPTVGLQGMEMRIKLVRESTTRCFPALFGLVLVLGLSRSGGLVCAVGASLGRLLLGCSFYVEKVFKNL